MAANPIPNIPDHELLRRIGRGSYGDVWLAKSATGAYRAVKVIYRESFDHDRPYEREFSGIKKFEPISRGSDTQVDILHVGRNDVAGAFYYVMELADDQCTGAHINPQEYSPRTLRSDLVLRGRLPLNECLEIALQLAAALEHLHASGLAHRDIKPSNIVFVGGRPKLADVGLVASLDAARSFVGTEGYIPAEGPGTPQADIYSLGKVLYEISTGRDRLDFPELPTDLKEHPERERLVQFNEIILRACDEDRKKRYQCAAEMLADLHRLQAGHLLRRIRPARAWKWAATIVVLAAGLGIGVIWATKAARLKRVHEPNKSLPPSANPGELPLTAGLVGWWQAEGNALDSSGTNHGRMIEGVGFDAGKIGQAFVFNGKTACISVPPRPAWTFGESDFSIALWANFAASSNAQALVACEKGYGHVDKWMFCHRDGMLRWHMDGPTNPIWLGTAKFSPAIGQWYHLAITRQGDRFRFYIDGAEVASETWAGEVPRADAPLTIGNAWRGLCFNGLLDDVRIYHRALAASELLTLGLTEWSQPRNLDELVVVGNRRYQRREFMISTSFEDINSQVNLAVLANGDVLATWHQGLHWHCYGQTFDAQGVPLRAAFLLSPADSKRVQWGPSPAPLPDGGFVVAYGESGPTNASTARRFDAACAPVGNAFSTGLPDWTCVASQTNGDFVAAGTYIIESITNDLPILARRFNSAGVPYGPTFQVSTIAPGRATVSAAYGADGRFAFAWPDKTNRTAWVRAYRSNEFSPFGVEFAANTVSRRQGLVSARYGLNNDLIVAWGGRVGANPKAVFVRRFDSNLVATGTEWQVNERTTQNKWATSLSLGKNHEAFISWDATDGNLYGRLLDPAGNPLSHEFRINQHTNGTRTLGWEACLHTAILHNRNLVVGWVGDGANGKGIYMTMLRPVADLKVTEVHSKQVSPD